MAVLTGIRSKKMKHVYKLHRNGVVLYTGTIEEIAKKHGTSINWLYFMTCPAYERQIERRKDPLHVDNRLRMELVEETI